MCWIAFGSPPLRREHMGAIVNLWGWCTSGLCHPLRLATVCVGVDTRSARLLSPVSLLECGMHGVAPTAWDGRCGWSPPCFSPGVAPAFRLGPIGLLDPPGLRVWEARTLDLPALPRGPMGWHHLVYGYRLPCHPCICVELGPYGLLSYRTGVAPCVYEAYTVIVYVGLVLPDC